MSPTPKRLEEPYFARALPPASAHYWSWLFSAPEHRDPLVGVYALEAEWRALMDPATERSAAELKFAWWREEILRLSEGRPAHPISRYLAALPGAEAVDFSPLSTTLEAAALQAAGAPLERGSELESHSSALYAAPLLVAASLSGHSAAASTSQLRGALSALAAAQYIASSLALYRREAARGRVIFPVDELLAASIEDTDLGSAEPPPRLQSYLNALRERASRLFGDAAQRLPRALHAPMRHLLILAVLGAKHLKHRSPTVGARPLDVYLAWSTASRAARVR
jgi:phytoene/squalene synthetase